MENEEREKLLKEREEWYNFIPSLFEMVKVLHNRELSFISQKGEMPKKAVRYLVAFQINFLKSHLNWMNSDKNLINLYHSVAKFKPNSIPVLSYCLKNRREEENYKDFNENYVNYVEEYNLFIDMDLKEVSWEKGFNEAKKLKKILEQFKVPYYLVNSSKKGFHFQIPSNFLPKMEISKLIEMIYNVIYNLKGIYDFETIDTSIADLKRLCKLPFSYVCDGSICLPLSDKNFENFSEELVSMKNVRQNIIIKNMGLLTRTYGLSDEKLKENTLNFINNFSS